MTNIPAALMLTLGTINRLPERNIDNKMDEKQEELNIFQMYLEEIGKIKDCDKTENEQLMEKILAGEKDAKSRLIEGNLKAALGMIQSFLNRGVMAADLVQEANMALVMAVEELETEDGQAAFEDILRRRVRAALQAIVDEQDTEKKIEEKMLARVNVLKDISKDMADELGREATVEELAERMKTTVDDIKDIMKLTLDAMSVTGEYEGTEILDGSGEEL